MQKEQPNPEVEIITLAFHVDYWNYLGWKDEFSSQLFTQRQQFYARKFGLDSAYTPQMVVDGKREFVGSNLGKAQQVVSDASKESKANIEIENEENVLKINISDIPSHNDSTIYLAIAEDKLASDVKRGENAGNKLEHVSVVRELNMVGKLAKSDSTAKFQHSYNLQTNWKPENLKFVVFIQENESRRVLGVNFVNRN